MLKLNTDEIKNLQFEVSIQGINYDELQGSLKFMIEDIEYGIPVKIQKDLVSVKVPPLQEIVAKGMNQGDVVECKLDIFGNGFYINPWGGQFELETTPKVKANQVEATTHKPEKKVVAELKKVATKKEMDNEAILEMLFQKLEEKGFKIPSSVEEVTPEPISSKPINSKSKPIVESKSVKKLSRKELVEQKIKSKYSKVNSLIDSVKSLTEGKKVIKNPVVKSSVVIEDIQTEDSSVYDKLQQLKGSKSSKVEETINVDKDDPIFLMESVGMKNPKIQEAMLDKAKELGGDGSKALAETLRKLLGITGANENPYEQYMNLRERHDQ